MRRGVITWLQESRPTAHGDLGPGRSVIVDHEFVSMGPVPRRRLHPCVWSRLPIGDSGNRRARGLGGLQGPRTYLAASLHGPGGTPGSSQGWRAGRAHDFGGV
jgi:hypothetical protein